MCCLHSAPDFIAWLCDCIADMQVFLYNYMSDANAKVENPKHPKVPKAQCCKLENQALAGLLV